MGVDEPEVERQVLVQARVEVLARVVVRVDQPGRDDRPAASSPPPRRAVRAPSPISAIAPPLSRYPYGSADRRRSGPRRRGRSGLRPSILLRRSRAGYDAGPRPRSPEPTPGGNSSQDGDFPRCAFGAPRRHWGRGRAWTGRPDDADVGADDSGSRPSAARVRAADAARDRRCAEHDHAVSIHTGTHIDAPSHFIAGGASIDEIPIERFWRPALRLDLSDALPDDDRSRPARGRGLRRGRGPRHDPAARDGLDRPRLASPSDLYGDNPFLAEDAAAAVAAPGPSRSGSTSRSTARRPWPNHTTLLGAQVSADREPDGPDGAARRRFRSDRLPAAPRG